MRVMVKFETRRQESALQQLKEAGFVQDEQWGILPDPEPDYSRAAGDWPHSMDSLRAQPEVHGAWSDDDFKVAPFNPS